MICPYCDKKFTEGFTNEYNHHVKEHETKFVRGNGNDNDNGDSYIDHSNLANSIRTSNIDDMIRELQDAEYTEMLARDTMKMNMNINKDFNNNNRLNNVNVAVPSNDDDKHDDYSYDDEDDYISDEEFFESEDEDDDEYINREPGPPINIRFRLPSGAKISHCFHVNEPFRNAYDFLKQTPQICGKSFSIYLRDPTQPLMSSNLSFTDLGLTENNLLLQVVYINVSPMSNSGIKRKSCNMRKNRDICKPKKETNNLNLNLDLDLNNNKQKSSVTAVSTAANEEWYESFCDVD